MKKSFPNILGAVIVFAFVFAFLPAMPAQAEVKIDISPGNDPLFDVNNAAPGHSKTEEARAENTGTEAEDLYLNIDDVSNDGLADELKFYLTDKTSGKYFIGGAGDRFTLHEMDKAGDVFIERLEPGQVNRYEVKVKFDEEAGNEFQDEEVKFDMVFGARAVLAAAPAPLRPGQAAGGAAGGGVVGPGEVQGAEEGQPEVAGAETGCSEWPLWVWILMLAIFTGVFNSISFYNYKERKEVRWFWQLALTVAVFLIWLYFDKCDLYLWFPCALIILGLAGYWYYLHRLRKIVSENQEQTKTE